MLLCLEEGVIRESKICCRKQIASSEWVAESYLDKA